MGKVVHLHRKSVLPGWSKEDKRKFAMECFECAKEVGIKLEKNEHYNNKKRPSRK